MTDVSRPPTAPPGNDRREAVLESALLTFARFGYRKTSMDEVARAAQISRPGLYFLFDSKEALFRAAVTQALERDIAAVERILSEEGRPLSERLLAAFDQWAGRYLGPLSFDVTTIIADNPALLGPIVRGFVRKWEARQRPSFCRRMSADDYRVDDSAFERLSDADWAGDRPAS